MRILVIYESMFGNARTIAGAIADGATPFGMVETVEVSQAPLAINEEFDLIITGGPTHAFGMSQKATRADAATKADRPLISRETGIREWLEAATLDGHVYAAAFDTSTSKPRWLGFIGSAAGKIEKRLKRLGFTIAAPPGNFYVTDTLGPLMDGEIQRAREWGHQVAGKVAAGMDVDQVA